MPSVAATMDDDPPAPDRWQSDLADLRTSLDRIDDSLHDLLMQRAEIVQQVAAAKPFKSLAFRPGREAFILKRLLARHAGALPPQAIVCIWLELFAGTVAMQSEFVVSVCDIDPACALTQLARERFGVLTQVHVHRSPAQAIEDLRRGRAHVAVLPIPSDAEPPARAWWSALLQQPEPRVHIVGRLPFWSPRPGGAAAPQALVAAVVAPDPSGDDRTLLGLQVDPASRARLAAALAAAGLPSGNIIQPAGGADALVEIPGFLSQDDPRLRRIGSPLRPPAVLGAYAIPILLP